VQILESFKDLFRFINFLTLHFNHKWFMHFGCVNRFLGLCHVFWDDILFQDVAHINDLLLGDA
jgi:hypothetical protein